MSCLHKTKKRKRGGGQIFTGMNTTLDLNMQRLGEIYPENYPNWDNITILNCSYNSLTKLPDNLPKNLEILVCSNNHLTKLPDNLPMNLAILNCTYNLLKELPAIHQKLIVLECSNNELEDLPDLPEHLETLDCSNNKLTELPTLPDYLSKINCSNNKLGKLPNKLPANLELLNCSNNLLTELQNLPENIIHLYCSYNTLQVLQNLPKNLSTLHCDNNRLQVLQNLPKNLTWLNCSNNRLTELHNLPSTLKYLLCSDNQLQVFPTLPITLYDIECENNPNITTPPNNYNDLSPRVRYFIEQLLINNTEPQPLPEGLAYEVHNNFASINFQALIKAYEEVIPSVQFNLTANNYRQFIVDSIAEISNGLNKDEFINLLNTSLIFSFNDFSPIKWEAIFYSLEFVKRQSPEFKQAYIDMLEYDIRNAYPSRPNNIGDTNSCAKGMVERIPTTVASAITATDSIQYNNIKFIITNNPKTMLGFFFEAWKNRHKATGEDPFTGDDEEANIQYRANSLKTFLENEFKQMYGTTDLSPEIMQLIKNKVEELKEYDGFYIGYYQGGKTRRRKRKCKSKSRTKSRRYRYRYRYKYRF